ncbi:TPA: hypothetical protein L6A41_07485 [Pseudomonas aeruginosa]|nr:hypothetical protein F3H14_12780 [Pseudomonas aeruginosa]KAA5617681.1 hypothetical protein F3H15_18130 [Pseudomonas aeruginosa]KAA5639544.1 hypothetical protein F3H16_19620 [Pseudomonas aeruginosa]KAA5664495.1 hypothetical protein F3G64_22185 [Pseudomonas aeruginosa]MCO3540909.1 hypothetical protein [Pseudomonas aeruginosa]
MYLPERESRNARTDHACEHQCGCGARLGGMTNKCEPLSKHRYVEQAKDADRLEPKGTQLDCFFSCGAARTFKLPVERRGSNPLLSITRNRVSPYLCLSGQANRKERC